MGTTNFLTDVYTFILVVGLMGLSLGLIFGLGVLLEKFVKAEYVILIFGTLFVAGTILAGEAALENFDKTYLKMHSFVHWTFHQREYLIPVWLVVVTVESLAIFIAYKFLPRRIYLQSTPLFITKVAVFINCAFVVYLFLSGIYGFAERNAPFRWGA